MIKGEISMNKNQIVLINEYHSELRGLANKVSEFNQKYFGSMGVLNPSSQRYNKTLSIGVFTGGTGQTIELDDELKPLVTRFIGELQQHYQSKIDNMNVMDFISKLMINEEPEDKNINENQGGI